MSARAQVFVDAHYPAGSPVSIAIRDFRHARAACNPDRRSPNHVLCSYVIPSHGFTGLVGSAVWRIDVYVTPGSDKVDGIAVGRRLAAD